MTDKQRQLAAEYALGVLEGVDLELARQVFREDEDFRREVGSWVARLTPLLDEVEPAQPRASLWARIERALGPEAGNTAANDNVAGLKQSVAWWRGATAGMTGLAAALAILLLLRPGPISGPPPGSPPGPTPAQSSTGRPMVAVIGDHGETKLVANWDPADRRLVLAVAGDMPSDPGRAHELWVIPAGGKPRSLGVMGDSKTMHMDLADTIAGLIRSGATIAISVEPPKGSPTGAPTGPVIASGTLETA